MIDFLFRHELRDLFSQINEVSEQLYTCSTQVRTFWWHCKFCPYKTVAKHCNASSKETRSTWIVNAAFRLTSQLMGSNNINDCRDWFFFSTNIFHGKIINRKKMNRNLTRKMDLYIFGWPNKKVCMHTAYLHLLHSRLRCAVYYFTREN